jgi:hypothetical protein
MSADISLDQPATTDDASTVPHDRRTAMLARWSTIRTAMPWLLIALGITLRCAQYAHDRSMFLDEVFVASNIAHKSFDELRLSLLFDQRAPLGFLWSVKLGCAAFGQSDLALRLAPLLSGILSLFVFHEVARRYIGRGAVMLAMLLFALAAPLIFYSSDLKQYSTEVLMCLVILWTFARMDARPPSAGQIALMGAVGAVSLWFSYTAAFVLAGMAACIGAMVLWERRWSSLWRFGLVGCIWAISFGALYYLQLRNFTRNSDLISFWRGELMPSPNHFSACVRFLAQKLHYLTTDLVGLGFGGLALVAAFFGIKSLYATDRRRLALLVSPIVVTLLASCLKVYPFSGRLILFLSPIPLLLIAEGIDNIRGWNAAHARLLAVCMAALLLVQPALGAKQHLISGRLYTNPLIPNYQFEEAKPVMSYMRDHWQEGDTVYLYSQSYVSFEYYASQYGFRPEDSMRGIMTVMTNPAWTDIRDDLQKLKGKRRVWVFFCHVWPYNGVDEKKLYLYFLDAMGHRLDQIETPDRCDGSAFLYDLST